MRSTGSIELLRTQLSNKTRLSPTLSHFSLTHPQQKTRLETESQSKMFVYVWR